jgi:hypothetical protein
MLLGTILAPCLLCFPRSVLGFEVMYLRGVLLLIEISVPSLVIQHLWNAAVC